MSLPKPIPLHSQSFAGTGFLVKRGAAVWLVTCVHIISGQKDTSDYQALFEEAQLHVVGTEAFVPLFSGGQQHFTAVINKTTGYLIDALAIRLSASQVAELSDYGMYDLVSVVRVQLGQRVTFSGFASIKSTLVPATIQQANVDRIEGISIALSKPSAVGISGGPVTRPEGLVGIVYGDIGAPKLTNALVISFADVASELFKS